MHLCSGFNPLNPQESIEGSFGSFGIIMNLVRLLCCGIDMRTLYKCISAVKNIVLLTQNHFNGVKFFLS